MTIKKIKMKKKRVVKKMGEKKAASFTVTQGPLFFSSQEHENTSMCKEGYPTHFVP